MPSGSRTSAPRGSHSVDLVLLSQRRRRLSVLLHDCGKPSRWQLPYDVPRRNESLAKTAERIAKNSGRAAPSLLYQVGAFSGSRHPVGSALSVLFTGMVPATSSADVDGERWFAVEDVPALPERQRAMLEAAIGCLRERVDHHPVAFSLLPPLFTLTDLQHVYEMLLGHRLHKASFRRALDNAALVVPTEEWRGERRGRPARLYRFHPRRRPKSRRAVRFDFAR